MAFVVEDGTGKSDANSYASVAEADSYVSLRGVTGWADLTTAEKQSALVKAADYLEATYRSGWQGRRVKSTQALSWPRLDVVVDDYPVASDTVPSPVKTAAIEMALKAGAGTVLLEDQGQRVIREKVDVIETEYAEFDDTTEQYVFVSRIVAPYLASGGMSAGGFMQASIIRT